jgi:hypothetical protein
MREMTALGKTEEAIVRAGGEIKYYPTGESPPHLSTLKKWYKIWRVRQWAIARKNGR